MRVYSFAFVFALSSSPASVRQSSSVSSGIDLKAIDSSVNPCQNFYQYACGGWMKANPIPPQYSRWSRFNELQNTTRRSCAKFWKIPPRIQTVLRIDQKIGTFYGSCMNEAAIDKAGYTPIKPALERIQSLSSKAGSGRGNCSFPQSRRRWLFPI